MITKIKLFDIFFMFYVNNFELNVVFMIEKTEKYDNYYVSCVFA